MKPSTVKRTVHRKSLESRFLNTTKEIFISLPPEYDKNQTYPLMLLHDGDDYFHLGRLITTANQMIANEEMKPVIFVAMPVDKQRRNEEYAPWGKSYEQHVNFVMEEVTPSVCQTYAITPSSQEWVIGGSSLGGTASLQLAIHSPSFCSQVLTQSGAFFTETSQCIEEASDLSQLNVYQSIGLAETAVSTHRGEVDLVTSNQSVYQQLITKKATVQYNEHQGDHTWGWWQQDLPAALRYFFHPST